MLIVRVRGISDAGKASDILPSVLAQNEKLVERDVPRGSLMHFHRRLGHFHYDTILQMTKSPASGNALTDEMRANYLTYAQRKQAKKPQSRKDTKEKSPIDVIGGMI